MGTWEYGPGDLNKLASRVVVNGFEMNLFFRFCLEV